MNRKMKEMKSKLENLRKEKSELKNEIKNNNKNHRSSSLVKMPNLRYKEKIMGSILDPKHPGDGEGGVVLNAPQHHIDSNICDPLQPHVAAITLLKDKPQNSDKSDKSDKPHQFHNLSISRIQRANISHDDSAESDLVLSKYYTIYIYIYSYVKELKIAGIEGENKNKAGKFIVPMGNIKNTIPRENIKSNLQINLKRNKMIKSESSRAASARTTKCRKPQNIRGPTPSPSNYTQKKININISPSSCRSKSTYITPVGNTTGNTPHSRLGNKPGEYGTLQMSKQLSHTHKHKHLRRGTGNGGGGRQRLPNECVDRPENVHTHHHAHNHTHSAHSSQGMQNIHHIKQNNSTCIHKIREPTQREEVNSFDTFRHNKHKYNVQELYLKLLQSKQKAIKLQYIYIYIYIMYV